MRARTTDMRDVIMILTVLGITMSPARLNAQDSVTTRAITDRYLVLTFGQEYDALLDVYAPDAVFYDPTGDVFQGPVAQGPVRGAEAIIAMQKGWGLAETHFAIRTSFTVGEYSLYRGTLVARYRNSDVQTPIPFVTVLRAEHGRITERTDFGEYIDSFSLGEAFDENTADTRRVADRYLRAYLDADLTTQAELLAPGVTFQDPTSKIFGPPSGEVYQGADVLMARRRQVFASVSNFEFDVDEAFVANHHAVFMGTTRYHVASGAYVQPAVFVIEVREGRVTRHWDFVDYTVGVPN